MSENSSKIDKIREFALSLPSVTEEPHFDLRSFRVHGKIFATITADERHVHIFVDEEDREWALAIEPENLEKLWWGAKVMGLKVHYQQASPSLVSELLELSWRRKAPKRLLAAYEKRGKLS